MSDKPIAAGKSSIDLVDKNIVLRELSIEEGAVFLDLACGNGAYSIAVAKHIGQSASIHAVDLWKEGVEYLQKEISVRQINNIHTHIADVSKHIPVKAHSVDVCLMATVLHDLIQDKTDEGTLKEVTRVLKPEGTLAVIEFKKIEGPPGPPLIIRISPEEVEKHLSTYSLHAIKTLDVGQYTFLSVFVKK